MAVFLALLGATAFALGTVLQQKGTLQEEPDVGGVRFLENLFRRPVWLLGAGAMALGWVLQAVALHLGSLVVVQSLMALSLVIALPFGAWLTDQRISRTVWLGAAAIVAGIVLFLSVGSPSGGTSTPPASAWWSAGLVTVGLIAALARIGRSRPATTRAVAYGAAGGLAFGLQAAVTKVFTDEVGNGVVAVLTGWEVYVLVLSALAGLALGQSALRTGALAPAMATSNALTLLSSVVLGLTVFGETLGSGTGSRVAVVAGLALAALGIAMLARAPLPEAARHPPRCPMLVTRPAA
jgi:drug/metabolite transporter (DMT)-like permease